MLHYCVYKIIKPLFLGRLLIYVEYKFLINFEDTLDIDKFFLFKLNSVIIFDRFFKLITLLGGIL